jgi:hypothetical protein
MPDNTVIILVWLQTGFGLVITFIALFDTAGDYTLHSTTKSTH